MIINCQQLVLIAHRGVKNFHKQQKNYQLIKINIRFRHFLLMTLEVAASQTSPLLFLAFRCSVFSRLRTHFPQKTRKIAHTITNAIRMYFFFVCSTTFALERCYTDTCKWEKKKSMLVSVIGKLLLLLDFFFPLQLSHNYNCEKRRRRKIIPRIRKKRTQTSSSSSVDGIFFKKKKIIIKNSMRE